MLYIDIVADAIADAGALMLCFQSNDSENRLTVKQKPSSSMFIVWMVSNGKMLPILFAFVAAAAGLTFDYNLFTWSFSIPFSFC